MQTPDTITIGYAIRTLRIALNLSQEGLAAWLGVTPQCIYYWENGRRFPHRSRLYLLQARLREDRFKLALLASDPKAWAIVGRAGLLPKQERQAA